jgi:hypothetical protein
MGWILRLVQSGVDGEEQAVDVIEIVKPDSLAGKKRVVMGVPPSPVQRFDKK